MFNTDVDFLNFGDVKLFMPKGDNLYNLYDPRMRGASLLDHYVSMTKDGHHYPLSREQLRQTADPRYALYAYLQMLVEGGLAIDMLDVGAFVGVIGLRCANLARCFGYDVRVKLFDPSIAGSLIPYNIEVNHLQDFPVEHVPKAVSLMNGPMLFSSVPGHLDSAHVVKEGEAGKTLNYIVRSTTFPEYFKSHPTDRHQIIKIDTEGMEPFLVQQLVNLSLPGGFSAIIELTPSAFAELGVDLGRFLAEISKTFDLFELYHFPLSTKVRHVELDTIAAFVREVQRYPHGHTDLLMTPHSLPDRSRRLARLKSFKDLPATSDLTLGAPAC